MPHVLHVFPGVLMASRVGFGPLLVPQRPVLHAERLRVSVRTPEVGIVCVFRSVAVFDPVGRLFGRSGGEVHHEAGLCAYFPAILDELARAEMEIVDAAPDQVLPRLALLFGTHPVFPVEGLDRRSAREPQHRRGELLHLFQHVAAESPAVGQRRVLVENASVDAASHVFHELSVHVRGDLAEAGACVDRYSVFLGVR